MMVWSPSHCTSGGPEMQLPVDHGRVTRDSSTLPCLRPPPCRNEALLAEHEDAVVEHYAGCMVRDIVHGSAMRQAVYEAELAAARAAHAAALALALDEDGRLAAGHRAEVAARAASERVFAQVWVCVGV